jgi:glycine oxidase
VSTTRESTAVFQPDVIVVGGGLIGLTCATSVARDGHSVLLLTSNEKGAASPASAGILAPSVGSSPEVARALGIASRDMYPAYVESLFSRTGVRVPLDRSGVLEIAFRDEQVESLRSSLGTDGEWIDGASLHALEPALAHAVGAAFHRENGSVDSVALLNAVTADASQDRRVSFREGRVVRVDARTPIRVELLGGEWLTVPTLVLAAGAWTGLIAGLPRQLPVVPVRGQMLAFGRAPIRHVILGPSGYIVPRGDRSLVGSTMEDVGFDARVTRAGAQQLRACAAEMVPSLADQPVLDQSAGLRPVTPDLLPIVGADPECSSLLYACGHSRNGVLLAPLTARVIADLIARDSTSIDISPYSPGRFRT